MFTPKKKKRCNLLIINAFLLYSVIRIGFEPMTLILEG